MSGKTWKKCIEHYNLPARPGVYAIYLSGELVYIGSSGNMRKRFAVHAHNKNEVGRLLREEIERVVIKFRATRKYGDWAMVELRLLRRLRPPLNCVSLEFKRATRRSLVGMTWNSKSK
jgi:excinuclease UvrABC nuclease subunit